jgi:hypothetical protein
VPNTIHGREGAPLLPTRQRKGLVHERASCGVFVRDVKGAATLEELMAGYPCTIVCNALKTPRAAAGVIAIVTLLPFTGCRRRDDRADADASAPGTTVLSDEKLVELAHAPIACPDIGTEQIVGTTTGCPFV